MRVRAALVTRLGPAWAAKTTEEIAAEASLEDQVGPEWAEPLIRFLRETDRVKFAAPPDDPEGLQGDEWDDWVAGFVAALEASGTEMSRSKG